MSAPTKPAATGDRTHYSYQHYADPAVADGFDALRFGGPIGKYLLESQEALLMEVLAPVSGRSILDVGTGTGRAALGLASAGARVVGLDASAEMLRVARQRATDAGLPPVFGVADAQRLPLASGAVDAAVCLRLLMHVVDWRQAIAELCRVSRWRVIVDFPAAMSFAALESRARKIGAAAGRRTEPYRVMAEHDVVNAFAAHGFRVIHTNRQFVLPINLHKKVGRLGFTRTTERALAAIGLRRWLGSPVTMVAER
jgi:SAM-dependent methyltransferase